MNNIILILFNFIMIAVIIFFSINKAKKNKDSFLNHFINHRKELITMKDTITLILIFFFFMLAVVIAGVRG